MNFDALAYPKLFNTKDLDQQEFDKLFQQAFRQYSGIVESYGQKSSLCNKTYDERMRNNLIGTFGEKIVRDELGATSDLNKYTDLILDGKILEIKCHQKRDSNGDFLSNAYGIRKMKNRLLQSLLEKEKRHGGDKTFDLCLCFYHENSEDESDMIPSKGFTIADHWHILRNSLQLGFVGVFDRYGNIIYNAYESDD